MVDRSYRLAKPTGPGPLKRAVDQHVIPALIDAAGGGEGIVEDFVVLIRQQPIAATIGCFCVGLMIGIWAPRRGRRSLRS